MGMISQLLADSADSYTGKKFMEQLLEFVQYLAAAVSAGLILYAVYIGYLFATASDANKRKAAKDRLVKAVASCLIVIALTSVLVVVGQNLSFTTVKRQESHNTYSRYQYGSQPTIMFSWNSNVGGGSFHQVDGLVKIEPKLISGFDNDNKLINVVDEDNQMILTKCSISDELNGWQWGRAAVNQDSKPGSYEFKFVINLSLSSSNVIIPVSHVSGNPQVTYIPIVVNFVLTEHPKDVQTIRINAAHVYNGDNNKVKFL